MPQTATKTDGTDVQKRPKIGIPAYRVVRQKESDKSLIFEVDYPEILVEDGVIQKPKYRLMSTFEQRKEPVDERYQYLLIGGQPFEVIGFKIPSAAIKFLGDSKEDRKLFEQWDDERRQYRV